MATAYNSKIITDGLVLCLDAANPKSYPGTGTTWYDLSGNGNHATLYNSPTFLNNTFSFDGINEYGLVPDSNSLSFLDNIFTFEFSAYFNVVSIGGILGKLYNWEYTVRFLSNGLLGFPTWNLSGNQVYYTSGEMSTSIVANKWYHFLYTANGTNSYLYKDGIFVGGNQKNTNNMGNGNNPLYIGAGGDAGGIKYLNGYIGHLKIYNKFLSPTEIQQNFQATRSRYGI